MATAVQTAPADAGQTDSLAAGLRRYLQLRDEKAALAEEAKAVSSQLDKLEESLIERMAMDGVQSLNIDGRLCYRSVERHCQFRDDIKGDPQRMEKAFRSLAAMGAAGIIKRSIHPSTLRAWVNELAEAAGGEVPPKVAKLLSIYEQDRLNVRKA